MNGLIEKLKSSHPLMKSWMEHMHRHPELSMEEDQTAKFITVTIKQVLIV